MSKRKLAFFLVIGLIAGLFITACAGVATGQVNFIDTGGMVAFGPSIDTVTLPALNFEALSPATNTALNTLAKAEMQTQHSGAACSRGGH